MHVFLPFSDPAAILAPPTSTTTNESATVQLTCEVEGKPEPTVTWLKDGAEVNTSDSDISSTHPAGLSNGRSLSKLTIRNAHRSDQGSYRCRASNGIGDIANSSPAILTVNCKYLLLSLVPLGLCWALWLRTNDREKTQSWRAACRVDALFVD